MKKIILLIFILLPTLSWGQLDGYITPGTDGHLKLPSLTTAQIFAISQPKEGMQAYDKSVHCMRFYNGISWVCGNSNSGSELIPSTCTAWKNGIATASETLSNLKSDTDGNILSLIYDGTNSTLKLKKFLPNGSLVWETLICTSYESNYYLKVKNVNEIIVVAYGENFNGVSTADGSYKVIINDAGNILSSVQIVATSLGLGPILGGINFSGVGDIEFDSEDNLIVVGNFGGTRTFGSFTLQTQEEVPYGFKREQFIVKINPAGTVLWAYQWDSNTTDSYLSSLNLKVFDLEIDENNDLFVSCNSSLTSGNCLIKNNTTSNSLAFTSKILLLKFSSNGTSQSIYSKAGLGPDLGYNSNQDRTLVRAASDGVYLIGRKTLGSSGVTNSYIFVDKINKSTNSLIWSKEIEVDNNSTNSLTSGYSITTDAMLDNNGGIYLSGYFGECMILTPNPNLCSHAGLNSSYADRYILKLNTSNGSFVDAKLMGSAPTDDRTSVFLTINRFGLYSASSFLNTSSVSFGSTPLITSGGYDAVFMRCN